MNAQDARDLMDLSYNTSIMAKIKQAASEGKDHVYINMEDYCDKKLKVIKHLESLGYHYEWADYPCTMSISWEES